MIMVTHDIQIAQQADRVVRLAEGRIEEWAPPWPDAVAARRRRSRSIGESVRSARGSRVATVGMPCG